MDKKSTQSGNPRKTTVEYGLPQGVRPARAGQPQNQTAPAGPPSLPDAGGQPHPVFLTGVACVGKTTIGARLAELLNWRFFDLDHEIESYFGLSITRLQNRFLTRHSFLAEASKALEHVLQIAAGRPCVIALPADGLRSRCGTIIKKSGGPVIVLADRAENILERITFYGAESRRIDKQLTESQKKHYLKEIQKDITFYKPDYARARAVVDIAGLSIDDAAFRLRQLLTTPPPA